MKKSIWLFAIATVSVVMMLSFSFADVPAIMSYQGFLTDDTGTALDGDYRFTFAIYNDPTAGDRLWREIQDVNVRDGLLSVLLGSVNPIINNVFDTPDLWLGILVEGSDELVPRTRLTSQAFSYRVKTIDQAEGGTITGDLNIVGNINSTSQITIESTGGGVTIRAGSSIVTVTPSGGVTIQSSDVSISSTGDLNISAANKLSLTANEIEVTAASTELYGTDSLVLNSTNDLMVRGTDVQIDATNDMIFEAVATVLMKSGTNMLVDAGIQLDLKGGVKVKATSGEVELTANALMDINGAMVTIN